LLVANVLYALSLLINILNVLDVLCVQGDIIFSQQAMGTFAGVKLMLGIFVNVVLPGIANQLAPKLKWNLIAAGLMIVPVLMLVFFEGRFSLE